MLGKIEKNVIDWMLPTEWSIGNWIQGVEDITHFFYSQKEPFVDIRKRVWWSLFLMRLQLY